MAPMMIIGFVMQAQFLSNDPSYLTCKKHECQSYSGKECKVHTCSGSVTFHVVNFRTDVAFVFFAGGFDTPCVLRRSDPIGFSNPNSPLYGHLSSIDSTGTSMKVTWVSGDNSPQQVQYGDGKSATSQITTFTPDDMCGKMSPAKDFGWHDPGYIHSAVMTGLQPSQKYSYRYGRDHPSSGSVYETLDSGGECGVAYETYFPMPANAKDKPWYSIEQASVHFTVISTEHDWTEKSEQVDLVLFGHVHNYERTCAVYDDECKGMPTKDKDGVDTYDNNNYKAPVHAIIGMAGFTLDNFPNEVENWSLTRISEFGYARFVNASTKEIRDSFHIIKGGI
ncbi:putative inactive purple acid phosphatase 24 [Cocos nucifera]|uniref:Putative inactive purple acid phosphatase 24 n=1 Tax=Cocos nucifera TaxID=13894 RepID=A0A8K0IR71_COCNU|nr:putative inactive purple acid phosphatase 24 [Cocos nucifera]